MAGSTPHDGSLVERRSTTGCALHAHRRFGQGGKPCRRNGLAAFDTDAINALIDALDSPVDLADFGQFHPGKPVESLIILALDSLFGKVGFHGLAQIGLKAGDMGEQLRATIRQSRAYCR